MLNDYILTFASIDYISFKEKTLLLEYFGGCSQIFENSYEDLYFSGILKHEKAMRLSREKVSSVVSTNMKRLGIKAVSIYDSDYPESLRSIYDPPIVLFYLGRIPTERRIGIVGARNCEKESALETFRLAEKLSEAGFSIVSGMAKGIDSAAHKGALKNGNTIAVLGCGVDICYPFENKDLKSAIEKQGCVLSEYIPGKRPTKYTFPARNRIISGLSEAIIVAEAGEKSGALITVEFALDNGNDVYVLGKNDRIFGLGTSKLYEEGAPMITAEDIDILV